MTKSVRARVGDLWSKTGRVRARFWALAGIAAVVTLFAPGFMALEIGQAQAVSQAVPGMPPRHDAHRLAAGEQGACEIAADEAGTEHAMGGHSVHRQRTRPGVVATSVTVRAWASR